jgi:hypothetical protein
MITVDNLLLQIVNFTSPAIEEIIPIKDSKVLRSLATSVTSPVFITENQSRLLIKILRENCKKITNFSDEINTALSTPVWSKNFRYIEQVKKLYISKNDDQDLQLFIEITFNSEIRKILLNLSKNCENLNITTNAKLYTADLTEKNIVALYEALEPLEFEIDEVIKSHYKTIKSWSRTDIENQFLLTNIEYPNFHKTITADLGLETSIDQYIINDRSVRYQYHIENTKNPGENLTEYLAHRSSTKVWVDKNDHDLTSVIASLIQLKRLPLLVVFDTIVNNKYLDNLKILSKALEENNIADGVGIYFRLPNDDIGKMFNGLISEKEYNHRLDEKLKVAAVMSGKIPKFFLTNPWRPMSVIALDTKMGLRHGKTSVYTNCCDLVIEWADEPVMIDQRTILK